jgi:glycosyltransferase involved in cell wall biosynthesis
MRSLRKECLKGNVIILLYQTHFDLSYMICLSCGHVPIIGYHLGGTPYAYNAMSFLSNLPMSLLERKALANVDVMLLGTELHYNAFKRFYRDIPKVVYPVPQCVDFDLFKPMDKMEARKSLGIGLDKKVVIHVGRFDKAKGFDTMLDILQELRRNYDIEAICIGGTKNDMLYKKAIESGVRTLEWLPQQELVRYYSASDVFLFPKFYDKKSEEDSERFMGAGVACAEALGCNLPIVGTNLKGFFATPEEMKGIGLIPKDREDLIMCIEDVLDNLKCYTRCREVAMKYYSWSPIVERLLVVFDELAEKYYGVKVCVA